MGCELWAVRVNRTNMTNWTNGTNGNDVWCCVVRCCAVWRWCGDGVVWGQQAGQWGGCGFYLVGNRHFLAVFGILVGNDGFILNFGNILFTLDSASW